MKEEMRIFFTAVMFYTRIPCPKSTDHSPEYINKATRYFPLIGWIVGVVSFCAFYLGMILFDLNIAILFSLIAGILTTGAFHEDGLADVFDGFGGGWTKSKILEIMKDSRVGAYGVIALLLLFGLKFFSLSTLLIKAEQLNSLLVVLIFVSYHSLARLTAVNIVFTSEYSREDESSKAKPIAKSHGVKEIMGAYLFGLLPLVLLCFLNWKYAFVLLPLFLLWFFSRRYFNKWIDGYTGDCLGAVEQLAECTTLLSFLITWKFM